MNYVELLAVSDKQQERIAELEKERDELKDKSRTLDNQLHELYHAMELISKIATVVPRDTAILEVINCYRTGELLEAYNLEQQVKALKYALANIVSPESIYNKYRNLIDQAKALRGE